MKFGSLFAGIGGIDLGLERAGMKCAWQVEIDPFCRQVLAKHWPRAKRFANVRDVGAAQLEWVDIIAGGFPCQDISLNGKGKGLAGERSGLWFEFRRIVEEVRPRFVLVENVAALRSRGLAQILRDLAALGFDAEWFTLSAADVGAAHLRERLFVVAHPPSVRMEGLRTRGLEIAHALARQAGRSDRGCLPHRRGDAEWEVEPDLRRALHGVPPRLVANRLKALGNTVMPQKSEALGRAIMELAA